MIQGIRHYDSFRFIESPRDCLNWQKRFLLFDYGWDIDLGTGIIKNSVSVAVSIRGCWIGWKR